MLMRQQKKMQMKIFYRHSRRQERKLRLELFEE